MTALSALVRASILGALALGPLQDSALVAQVYRAACFARDEATGPEGIARERAERSARRLLAAADPGYSDEEVCS